MCSLSVRGVARCLDGTSWRRNTFQALPRAARTEGNGKAPALSNPSMEAMTTAHNYTRMLDAEDVDAAVVAIAAYLSPD